MGAVRDAVENAFRDFNAPGVASSGIHEPEKPEIRYALGALLERELAGIIAGIQSYATVAAMTAVTSSAAGTLAYVYKNNGSANDPANGFYQYTGSAWEAADWYNAQVAEATIQAEAARDVALAAASDADGDADAAAASAAAAQAFAASAIAAPGTSATSTTSLTINSGTQSLTVQTGKNFVVGMPVVIARTSAPATTRMWGTVTSYVTGTGALTVNVPSGQTAGTGTHTDWTISISGEAGSVGSQIVSGETLRNDFQRVMRTNTSRGSRARVVWIMDDGYRSNFINMAPILERRGQVACIAAEIDRIGSPYTVTDVPPTNRGTIAHPTCTAADYRELILRGWQILNHMKEPTGGASLATVIAGYRAENRLLQEILTGAKVATGTIGVFNNATPTHPEFDSYAVTGGVYRGGVNNPVWDNATRYVFDSGYRDVPDVQDQPYLYFFDGAKPTALAGMVIDIPNRSLASTLSIIEALAGTDATLIIYGHHTPVDGEETSSPPSLNVSAVDAISRKLYECGIQTCTWSQAFPGNLIHDPRFETTEGTTFAAASGDTAAFQSSTLYVGEARNVELTATAFRGNATQTSFSRTLATQPWHLYRVRTYYVIPSDLTLSGGSGSRNAGLAVTLTQTQIGGAAYSGGSSNDWDQNGAFVLSPSATSASSVTVGRGSKTWTIGTGLNIYIGQPWTVYRTSDFNTWMRGYVESYNSATGVISIYVEDFEGAGTFTDWTFEAYRRPFRATNGKVYVHECIVPSLDGFLATLFFGLFQCTGTVRIVHVSTEDLGSYEKSGLTFPTAFNTTVNRLVTLPALPQSTTRRRRWRAELSAPIAAPTYTVVTFAEEDSAAITTPATNDTVYVLGKGAGAFANQGGRIGTWNGSAWTFADQPIRTWVRCNNVSQGIGGGRRWFHRFRSNAAGAINKEYFVDEPFRDGHAVVSGVVARIGNETGSRSDACMLHIFPAWENPTGA